MPSIAPIAQQSAVPLTVLTALLVTAVPSPAQFSVTNLVTDDQSVNTATITDAHLQNAWGISSSASSPFWVSANATGLANLYSVNPGTNATTKVAMEVTIPGDGSVTGQTFSNVAGNFNGDTFLFVSEDGTVSGWHSASAQPPKRCKLRALTMSTRVPRSSTMAATSICTRPTSGPARSTSSREARALPISQVRLPIRAFRPVTLLLTFKTWLANSM